MGARFSNDYRPFQIDDEQMSVTYHDNEEEATQIELR